MWGKVSELLGLTDTVGVGEVKELHLATAALLVQVSLSDGEMAASEKAQLIACLSEQFSLDTDIAEKIFSDAQSEQNEANCLYKFTRVVASELDQEGRQEIVRLLWQVALADNRIDNFEENVLAKVSGLLGVSAQDRIQIKHAVMAGRA
ncbi:MAG: TerB family tellurite resistance protein [Kordiimonas sp.]